MVLTPFYQEKLTLRFDQSRSVVRYTVYSIKYKSEQAEVQGMAVKDYGKPWGETFTLFISESLKGMTSAFGAEFEGSSPSSGNNAWQIIPSIL